MMPPSQRPHHRSTPPRKAVPGDSYRHPHTVEELTQQNVEAIVELEQAAKAQRRRGDRIADVISDFCGTMTFVWVHIGAFSFWSAFNLFAPKDWRFDPFPFFFLSFIVALEAIFLSTFILISQNHEKRLSERRNHLDLQINLLTEQENTKILQLLGKIAEKVGVSLEDDPDIQVLEKSTRPEQLIEQIDRAVEATTRVEEAEEKAESEDKIAAA